MKMELNFKKKQMKYLKILVSLSLVLTVSFGYAQEKSKRHKVEKTQVSVKESAVNGEPCTVSG